MESRMISFLRGVRKLGQTLFIPAVSFLPVFVFLMYSTAVAEPVADLSAGSYHTCAVETDGTVVCWGKNVYGQSTPPAGTFIQVSAGAYHTCGLTKGGTVTCWGDDDYGQSTPPAGTFIQVSAGGYHTCGVLEDQTVTCWVNDNWGQSSFPSGTFTQVSAGVYHTCGVRTDGTVACWGNNGSGQSAPPSGTFKQVSAKLDHTCGVRTDGTVACWGNNNYGQSTPPSGTFTQVSAGGYHTCGVTKGGTVTCWGNDDYGQSTPPSGTFTQVSAGQDHSCGLEKGGTVACWGSNQYGQSAMPASLSGGRVSPSSLSFHSTLNVQSAAQTVTVTNTRKNTMNIKDIYISGPNYLQFALTNNCGSSIPAGSSCTIDVTFRPTWPNPVPMASTLYVSLASPDETYGVPLSGTVDIIRYTLTPSALSFLSPLNVESAAQNVTLTNTGNLPLAFSSIEVGGANSSQFAQNNNCGSSLAVGASCEINVAFKPTWLNALPMNAKLYINMASSLDSKSVPLSGIVASPSLSSHSQLNVQSAAQTVTLFNGSGVAVTIDSITIAGPNYMQFAQTNNCGSSLAAYASCQVNVTFKPTWVNTDPMRASLFVTMASPASSREIALSGTVDFINYSVTPASLSFHSPLKVQTAAQTVTISNTDSQDLTIKSITINGANYLQFAQTNNCGSSLAAGATCEVNVTFKPTWPNTVPMSAALNINVASPAISKSVVLSGTIDY